MLNGAWEKLEDGTIRRSWEYLHQEFMNLAEENQKLKNANHKLILDNLQVLKDCMEQWDTLYRINREAYEQLKVATRRKS